MMFLFTDEVECYSLDPLTPGLPLPENQDLETEDFRDDQVIGFKMRTWATESSRDEETYSIFFIQF